jgi:hypothetical protein
VTQIVMFQLLNIFEQLSLFPSREAIQRGDRDYHAAVNISNEMHQRYAHWSQGGW